MPSSSSQGSGSRYSRSTGEEPKRRKRYSLRIEFLDDDDDIELDRSLETAARRRRSNQRSSSSPRTSNGPSENARDPSQRSRRTSVNSIAAVIGPGNRGGPPLTTARPPSARGRHEATRTHANHTNQHEGNPVPTVEQLSEDFNRHMSVRDRSDPDLTERFQQQMSLNDAEPSPPHNHRSRRTSQKSAYTQTDLRGLGWSTLNLDQRPPTPIPAFLHPHSSNSSQDHRNIEAVYREGFEAGRRSATSQHRTNTHSSPLIPPVPSPAPAPARQGGAAPYPYISPPRPISRQGTPIPSSARNRPADNRSRTRSRERQEQPQQQQQSRGLRQLFRRAREP
ncbi:hypothetical protein F4805DRAFT_150217 [Annulohypoxylon moriforme]|nr:hypothetical protein F4805DRAFT_150217 [Annulohypoxylon moriforme]